MTDRPRGPWDEAEPPFLITAMERPYRRWVLLGLVAALVATIVLLVALDRRGGFTNAAADPRPRPAETIAPAAFEAPAFDPRYDVPRPAMAADNPTDWFSSEDYPIAALRAGLAGRTRIAFQVGPDGRVSACRIVESSGAPILDATTCGLIRQRGRYWPARDRGGDPVASEVTRAVRWQLP